MARLAAPLLLLLLAACTTTVRTPGVEVQIAPAKVQVGGGFCPPGQARKGAC